MQLFCVFNCCICMFSSLLLSSAGSGAVGRDRSAEAPSPCPCRRRRRRRPACRRQGLVGGPPRGKVGRSGPPAARPGGPKSEPETCSRATRLLQGVPRRPARCPVTTPCRAPARSLSRKIPLGSLDAKIGERGSAP